METSHTEFSAMELMIGVFLLTMPVDLLCIVIDLTGVGLAVAPILQILALLGVRWWFKTKGDKNALRFDGKQIVRYLSNLLPLVPTVTIVFLFDVYIHNHPEKFGAIQKIAGGIPKKL